MYDRFITRVADGRRLSKERVNEIGRGRIWSGLDALELGLIDELGDLQTGLTRARELAGLPHDAPAWNAAPVGCCWATADPGCARAAPAGCFSPKNSRSRARPPQMPGPAPRR